MMIWLQYEYRPRQKSGIARETVPIIHGDTGHFAGQSRPAPERGTVQPRNIHLNVGIPGRPPPPSVYITRVGALFSNLENSVEFLVMEETLRTG